MFIRLKTKMQKFEIEHFLRPEDGRDVFLTWLQGLRDMRAKDQR